jgi:hypothetical protein
LLRLENNKVKTPIIDGIIIFNAHISVLAATILISGTCVKLKTAMAAVILTPISDMANVGTMV